MNLGGEFLASLTTTRGHDCTTCTRTHTKTEAVNTRAASVVRLERPLALGHGEHSSKIIDALVASATVVTSSGELELHPRARNPSEHRL